MACDQRITIFLTILVQQAANVLATERLGTRLHRVGSRTSEGSDWKYQYTDMGNSMCKRDTDRVGGRRVRMGSRASAEKHATK